MAIITELSEQKNKKRVNVFVDDAFFCGLNKETAVKFSLKVGKEITEEKLKEACEESEVKAAFEKATDILGSRMHSKKEIFDKLLKKGYEKTVIEKAITKLEDYGFIDDRLFAKEFVASATRYSKKIKEQKLKQKGVSSDIVSEILGDEDDCSEFELCKKQAEKYAKNKDISTKEGLQKLYASLSRKGFDFDTIKKACKNISKNQDFDEI